jgi:hypothetical protein
LSYHQLHKKKLFSPKKTSFFCDRLNMQPFCRQKDSLFFVNRNTIASRQELNKQLQ